MPELVVGWIMEMGDAENIFVDFEIGRGMIVHPEGRHGRAGPTLSRCGGIVFCRL